MRYSEAIKQLNEQKKEAYRRLKPSFVDQPFFLSKPYLRYENGSGNIETLEASAREAKELVNNPENKWVGLESACYFWNSYQDRFEGSDPEPCDEFVTIYLKEEPKN